MWELMQMVEVLVRLRVTQRHTHVFVSFGGDVFPSAGRRSLASDAVPFGDIAVIVVIIIGLVLLLDLF